MFARSYFVCCFICFTNSISLLVIGLFKLFILSLIRLGRLYVSRKYSISSQLSNSLAWLFIVFFYDFFVCLWYYFSSFILYFTWVLFSSWWACLNAYQFYLFVQEPFFFVSLIISIISIYFSLIFMISFLQLTLTFSFSGYFRCKFRLFEIFLVSLGKIISL